ncbi:MAG: phosphoenolpyruvate carboxykinase (ATP) [bacterium]|nr:phosphoenolpyruvate carboxykinase (ATP) [bacterium]
MEFLTKLARLLEEHQGVLEDLSRKEIIRHCVENHEVVVSPNGALSTITPVESTGRTPKDTYIVKRDEIAGTIDWDSPNNLPLDPGTFDMILEDALAALGEKSTLYVTNRVIGADSNYALPVKTVTPRATSTLFIDNMFRPVPDDIDESIFADRPFTMIVLPYDQLDSQRYDGLMRRLPNGGTSGMAVIMDVANYIGVVYGSEYLGSSKKLMFTVMNYLLPGEGILPLHCSANEGNRGDIAVLAGLSGTGKTTLSADPSRALLGDDEHGWSDNGIANFENGCYAKLIDLNPEKEPEIYHAMTHEAPYEEHGAIAENATLYPDRGFDFYDVRLTQNSRGSYPLSFLSNIKPSSVGGHPTRILFLTADANGVLPPVSKLTPDQAMLWFIMGYTSKLAGTELGVKEPVSTFSRFFGQPFMPCNPDVYASMLGKKMQQHDTQVFLINTGWSGGAYGVGKRIDINVTRAIVTAALDTELEGVQFEEDRRFHVLVPSTFPGVDTGILDSRNTWEDKAAFDKRADQLAADFSKFFDKTYGNKNIAPGVVACCPGK